MTAKNYLLCVSGMSPAIITETYYWMAKQRHEKIIADEVLIITTAAGKQKILDELLVAPNNRFSQMAKLYGWPENALTADNVFVVQDKAGHFLDDVREPEEFAAFADLVLKVIAEKTSESNCRLHASLAGGRKTMSYYLGLAMNIFGRSNDTLSHVLLDVAYEQAANFYYPGQAEKLHKRDKDKTPLELVLDGDHIVEMSEFPIINLSKSINVERLRSQHLSFDDVLTIIKNEQNGIVEPLSWAKVKRKYKIKFGHETISLPPTELAMLLWLAWRAKRNQSPVDMTKNPDNPDVPTQVMKQAYLEYLLLVEYVKNPSFTLYKSADDLLADNTSLALELSHAQSLLNKVQPIHSRLTKNMQAVSSAYLQSQTTPNLAAGVYHVNGNSIDKHEYHRIQQWMNKFQPIIKELSEQVAS